MRDALTELDAAALATVHLQPVVVVDERGVVRSATASAKALLPNLVEGASVERVASWLADARRHCTQSVATADEREMRVVSGVVDGRPLLAHPTTMPSGDVAWTLVDYVSRELFEAHRALTRQRARIDFLLTSSSSLMTTLDLAGCRELTARMAAKHLADTAMVVMPSPGGRRMTVCCSDSAGVVEQRTSASDPVLVAGLGEALGGFPPVPSRWLDPASLPPWLAPCNLSGLVKSMMIVSIVSAGTPVGALVLLRGADREVFDDSDEMLARQFAVQAGAALSAARRRDEQARTIRALLRNLSPPRLRPLQGIECAGGYRAADDYQDVGGDFYDVYPGATPSDESLIVLGDVCGKGLGAAVLTGKIRNTVRALVPLSSDHDAVLQLLNKSLLSAEDANFATMVLASVRRLEDQVTLRLTRAGHLPPLIVRSNGRVEEADTAGTVIGALSRIKEQTLETCLAPGELCVLYTDGVTEARGGHRGKELFGEQRLRATLQNCAGMPAQLVVERVIARASEWVGPRSRDDIAVVVIAAPTRTHLSAVDGHTRGRYTA